MEAREERNEGNGKACHLIPFPILWFLKLCLGEREGITLPNLPSMASLLPSYPSHPFTLLTTIGEREGYDVIARALEGGEDGHIPLVTDDESRLEGGERMDTSFGHRPSIPYSPSLSLSLSHSFPSPPTSARTWRLKMGGDRV